MGGLGWTCGVRNGARLCRGCIALTSLHNWIEWRRVDADGHYQLLETRPPSSSQGHVLPRLFGNQVFLPKVPWSSTTSEKMSLQAGGLLRFWTLSVHLQLLSEVPPSEFWSIDAKASPQ